MNEQLSKQNISMYRDMVTPRHTASIIEIYKWICEGVPEVESKLQLLRQLYKEGKSAEADSVKKSIPSFTVSGICRERRSIQNLWAYSQYLVLDLDNLTPEELKEAKERAKAIEYTVMAFVSPSGNGLKIIVKVDSQKELHTIAYQQVRQYYEGELGHTFDNTQDCARLCFLSYDPEAYLNPNFVVFPVDTSAAQSAKVVPLPVTPPSSRLGADWTAKLKRSVEYTVRKIQFEAGNRNNYILRFAGNANRYGIPKDVLLKFAIERYQQPDFSKWEIEQVVNSAYKNVGEFDTWQWPIKCKNNTAEQQRVEEEDYEDEEQGAKEEHHANNPYIPDEVVEMLPVVVKELAMLHADRRERDIFIISFFTLMSGALPMVGGYYDGNHYTPALYSYVVAPPASGKGVIKNARILFEPYHRKLRQKSTEAFLQYKEQLEIYEQGKSKGTVGIKEPDKPPFKVLFIPGNITPAAMYDHLKESDGVGVFCETEADTFSQNMKSDMPARSALLRNAYHHEQISVRRKSDGLLEIDCPKIAALFASTPARVLDIIPSSEDGLFSRFLFYRFFSVPGWRDVSPLKSNAQAVEQRAKIGEQLVDVIEWLNEGETTIELSEYQWGIFNKRFSTQLTELACFYSLDISSTVKRLGLATFRIAMVLTAMRKWEEQIGSVTVQCSDKDFDTAMRLSDVFIQHAVAVHRDIPKPISSADSNLKRIYDALPTGTFDRKTALECIKKAGIKKSDRLLDTRLKQLVEFSQLRKDEFNSYFKSDPSQQNEAA